MNPTRQKTNKALVLEAFDTLFNKRDYAAAERYWSSNSAKGLSSRFSMMVGGSVSIAGMGLLALSTYQHSLSIFLTAVAAGGVGSSLSFLGGLNLINANAPVQHRGGTLSAVLLITYFMQGFVAQLLGVAATAWGLRVAVDLGSVAIALLGIAAILLATLCQQTPVGGAR